MSKRTNFTSWQELEQHWFDGLAERVSLIRYPFSNPIFVHPEFLPFPIPQGLDKAVIHRMLSLETLDLPRDNYDLILFSPFLQWTQDVPGMLKQAYDTLKENGFFVGCFFGQDTLIEFKSVCAEFDLKHTEGLQQRFLPMIHTKDAGMLMQRAGFSGPTADIEHLSFSMRSAENLVKRLRESSVNNAKKNMHQLHIPTTMLPRTFLAEANYAYAEQYPHPSGGINVTIDLIFMCGWKQTNLKVVTR